MTENAADLIITIKSIWNGELPNSDAILLFEKIQESFNASIKSINPKLSKGKYPVLITKMKTGSTNVEWNYQRNEKKQPDMFDNEELGSKAFKLMCENVEMMSKEKNDGIDEQIIQPIADMQRIFSKHNQINTLYLYFQRINKKMSINKNKCLKTIESIQKKKLIQKENSKQMKIIGTLKEIDTRNEGGCIIESPFLGDVKCSYPSELEKQICSMIAPPRQDVICEGLLEFNEKNGLIKIFHIEKITYAKNLFDKLLQEPKPSNWEKHVGILKDVAPEKSADDITQWMIETLWG